MKALVISGGDFSYPPSDFDKLKFDIVIAADKGYLHAEKMGIVPDIFVGDCDSLPQNTKIKSPEIISLTPEKDMTDTEAAIDTAIKMGATKISVFCALGGRIDHTLGNIELLKYGLDRGVAVTIEDSENYITLIEKSATIPKKQGFCLSLIPLTTCENVSVSGVFYPLTNAKLDLGNTLGISNEFVNDDAKIELSSGLLLVLVCKSK